MIKQFKSGDKVLLFNSHIHLFGHGKLCSKWEVQIMAQSPSTTMMGIHSRQMANAINYSLSQTPRISRKWMSSIFLNRIIASIGLRDLNSIVMFSIGFPFPKIFFPNFQNKG
jgi:hypothetical protein